VLALLPILIPSALAPCLTPTTRPWWLPWLAAASSPTPACALPPRHPHPLGALNACGSSGPLPHPSKIHEARARPRRWRGGVAGEWAALPHPGDRAPSTPAAGINRPSLLLLYVAYVCFMCFKRFRCTLHSYVAIVLEACCKCMFRVFQMFQRYVSSVFPDACCKCTFVDVVYVPHIRCMYFI
jgi:hypothetical protein